MRGVGAPLLLGLALAGCVDTTSQVIEGAAQSTLNRTLLAERPDLPLERAIDCTYAEATLPERRGLASDAPIAPTASSRATLIAILSRSGTQTCLRG